MNARAPSPPPPAGAHPILGGEDLLVKVGLAIFGGLFALGALVYGWGQLAGRIFGRGAPRTGLAATAHVLLALRDHLGDPARAWPAADRRPLPGPAGFYGALALGLTALALCVGAGVWCWRRRGGSLRWPRRARAGARWAERRPGRREPPAEGFAGAREARAAGYEGPRLEELRGPARWLIGLAEGQPLWCPEEANLLVLGPARSRKSSGVIRPNLARFPGGLLVTSTRPEAYGWARTARPADERPFWVFDPAGLLGADEAAGWWPWLGAEDWNRAVSVANAMTAGLEDHDVTNGRHFAEGAAELLAPILHAAALTQAGIGQVRAWLSGVDGEELLGVLRSEGSSTAAADLSAFQRLRDDRSGGKAAIVGTARRALRWSARDDVRAHLDPAFYPTLQLERLVREGGTLVMVSPAHRMAELAPLMSALLAACVETAQEIAFRSDAGRLSLPMGFILDELATIAPFPGFPALMATGGGSGLLTLAACQDLSQLAERYGAEQAQTIWSNARVRLVTPGALDERTEEAAIRAAGELLALRRSGGATRGRSHSGAGPSGAQESAQEGWREGWESAIRRGELARMPLGTALCLPAGSRPLHVELVGDRGLPQRAAAGAQGSGAAPAEG